MVLSMQDGREQTASGPLLGGHLYENSPGMTQQILPFIGDHYFEAEISKGEIKVGDIAKKDATSLLVQPAK